MTPPTPPTPPTLVIAGPTAGGKSALSLDLAARVGAARVEIVAADAFQVYRGLDIGTAKPTPEERARVPHHLIDVAEPTERFTLHDWLTRAQQAITEIRGRGHWPLVVGGTHLYVKALLDGLFEGPGADEGLRAALYAMDAGARRAELERVDPAAAARIHPNDERRTVRALEVFRLTGRPISEHQTQWDGGPESRGEPGAPGMRLVVLDWPVDAINRRINARVRAMMEQGLAAEARGLWEAGRLGPQAREALGYKQLIPVFEGTRPLDEAVERIKIDTRRFAKSQRTWLRRLSVDARAIRIDAGTFVPQDWSDAVLSRIEGVG
ncbi:MAG: tRNA (adenosine(37)-N6)-dimethylallyltransferase MiaA [Planctomycetota bacterium]|nr:tRNA (adenosine(37)-N6)-dimethylallyltransferase MiaA [Planctomycetota bacterium]